MQYHYRNINKNDDPNVSLDTYTSQENAFIKYITQIDAIPNIVDNDFFKKYYRHVLFSGKFKGLSFINNPKTVKLNSLQRIDMNMEEDAGLEDSANRTLFDNIDICQVTRGTKGNLQYALITQRQEFKDTSEQEKKKSILSHLMHGKKETEETIEEGY